MKKSISITINSLVFQIEEDAYKKLDGYLESIKKYYGSSKEGSEILADIETSIAEKFDAKINSKKKVVTSQDIDEVIKVMGTVDEFSKDAEIDTKKRGEKQRNFIKSNFNSKRLYRNLDDAIIAGVCSGIAAYFGIDPVFVRLIFILLVFVSGFGILAYLILWLVVPAAKTNSQKLEMQGRPVNLTGIQEVVKEKAEIINKEGKAAINRLRRNKSWYNILNFPIKILESTARFLRNVLKKTAPILSVFFGVIFMISALTAILNLSVAIGMMLFNINSPYIISDIPFEEFSHSVFYYIGMVSVFLIAAVPLVFLLILSMTMIRRKNTFRLFLSGILLAIWMIAVVGAAVSAGDLVPKISVLVLEANKKQQASKDYDYKDFNKIYLGGNINAEIVKGDEFTINMAGRSQDMDRLDFNIEEGQLQITQKSRETDGKLCFFCFDKDIKAEIVLPQLDSYVGVNSSKVLIKGFDDNIYVSLGESAKAKFNLMGQNLECKLAGMDSVLTLTGEVRNLNCGMIGYSKLETEDLKAENIELKQDVWSKAFLEGQTNGFEPELQGMSKLYAFEMPAANVLIKAADHTRAQIKVLNRLEAYSEDHGEIVYRGAPIEIIKEVFEDGSIESVGYEYINKSENLGSGNVGADCNSHDQCKTPFQYLAQSTCPHLSLCIENKCKVVCPRILSSEEDPNHPSENIPYVSPQVECNSDVECRELCFSERYNGSNIDGACVEGNCFCVRAE